MGNCVERYTMRPMDMMKQQHQQQEEETKTSSRLVKINDSKEGDNGQRMKIVLTKEELKWLIFQLNEKGGMRIEQVLEEIERGREKVERWKPYLESIVEAPEILEIN